MNLFLVSLIVVAMIATILSVIFRRKREEDLLKLSMELCDLLIDHSIEKAIGKQIAEKNNKKNEPK